MSDGEATPVSEQSQASADAASPIGSQVVDAYNGLAVFGGTDNRCAAGDSPGFGHQDFGAGADESAWENALASCMQDTASEAGAGLSEGASDAGAGLSEGASDAGAEAAGRHPSVFDTYRATLESFCRGDATAQELSQARQEMMAEVLRPTLPECDYLPRGAPRGATQEGGRHGSDASPLEDWQNEVRSRREKFDAAIEMNRQAIARDLAIDAQAGLHPNR
jgi:hypothetical protein